MESKQLPIMKLDSEKQKELFNLAVERRYNSLIDKIGNSIDSEKKMKIDFDELKEVFEKPYIDISLKSEIRLHRFQKLGSCKKDYWLQIKDIFISRLEGRPYNYSLIDYEDIEELLNLYESQIPQLYNQIWTEAYYQYYMYLVENLKKTEDEKTIRKVPEIELNLTEKMLIISYLQKFNQFPKNDQSQDRKSFDRFIAILFDDTYENIKSKYKILDTIKSGRLSDAQKKDRIKNLTKVQEVIKLLGNSKLEQIIQNRINELY